MRVAKNSKAREKQIARLALFERLNLRAWHPAPEDKVGLEAFAVIPDAMKKTKMVGAARVAMARRERAMMIEPFGKSIMGTPLYYPHKIKGEDASERRWSRRCWDAALVGKALSSRRRRYSAAIRVAAPASRRSMM
jgi:hypothetical protein